MAHVMSLIFFPMSIGFMSHVDFKKRPCRPVKFKGQGPQWPLAVLEGWLLEGWLLEGWPLMRGNYTENLICGSTLRLQARKIGVSSCQ